MKKQIILASYKTIDTSFLHNEYCKDIPHVIYDKTDLNNYKNKILNSDATIDDLVYSHGNVVHLPNLGLASHVHLYHIVKNYDNLADIMIFIAGDNLGDRFSGRTNTEAFETIRDTEPDSCPDFINLSGVWGNYPLRGECYRFLNERFAHHWESLFHEKIPTKFSPAIDTTFLTSKIAIQRQPLDFYEKALELIGENCYKKDYWKMKYEGEVVSVMAPSKKNLQKFPHKSPKHFDFPACAFFEHSFQRIFDMDFYKRINIR